MPRMENALREPRVEKGATTRTKNARSGENCAPFAKNTTSMNPHRRLVGREESRMGIAMDRRSHHFD